MRADGASSVGTNIVAGSREGQCRSSRNDPAAPVSPVETEVLRRLDCRSPTPKGFRVGLGGADKAGG